MAKRNIEIDEKEQLTLIRGLEKISADAEKIAASADRMNIQKAKHEVEVFKLDIEKLKNKVMGKETLI